jgi:hypothetical protein
MTQKAFRGRPEQPLSHAAEPLRPGDNQLDTLGDSGFEDGSGGFSNSRLVNDLRTWSTIWPRRCDEITKRRLRLRCEIKTQADSRSLGQQCIYHTDHR